MTLTFLFIIKTRNLEVIESVFMIILRETIKLKMINESYTDKKANNENKQQKIKEKDATN